MVTFFPCSRVQVAEVVVHVPLYHLRRSSGSSSSSSGSGRSSSSGSSVVVVEVINIRRLYIIITKCRLYIIITTCRLYIIITTCRLYIIITLRVAHRPKYKGQFSMDYCERGSHTRDVYPTQDTSRMG